MTEFDDVSDLSPDQQAVLDGLVDPDEDFGEAEYKWDENFQRHILGMLLSDQYFLLQALPLVKSDYFTNDIHKLACRKLFRYFNKYKFRPKKIYLLQEVEDALRDKDDKVQWRYLTEVRSVYEFYVPGVDDRDYLLDKICGFAKIQAIRQAFDECLIKIKRSPESDDTWTTVHSILREAMQVDRQFDIGLEYFQSYEERYENMGGEEDNRIYFTSAFKDIDNALVGGGPSLGELYSFVGLSGSGKSLALVSAAVKNITELGKRVLYISLEMDENKIAQRFDAQFSKVNISELEEHKDIVMNALKEEISNKEDKRLLVIKQFPPGSMGMDQLRAYMNQLSLDQFKPDLLIVDYIGEMKDYPNMPTWESRYRIVRDLRGFAVEEQICVFTAMQPNKSAREAQKDSVIDDDNLADAYGQIRPLDGCWSINQIKIEKDAGIARLFVVKHRHGKSRFTCYVEFDMDTLQMRQISKAEYERRRKVQVNSAVQYKSDVESDVALKLRNKSKGYFEERSGPESETKDEENKTEESPPET